MTTRFNISEDEDAFMQFNSHTPDGDLVAKIYVRNGELVYEGNLPVLDSAKIFFGALIQNAPYTQKLIDSLKRTIQ